MAALGRTSIYAGVFCSAPLGRRNRVGSHATKVPKGLLPDLIAREYGDTQLVSHDTNAIAAMIAVEDATSTQSALSGDYTPSFSIKAHWGTPEKP